MCELVQYTLLVWKNRNLRLMGSPPLSPLSHANFFLLHSLYLVFPARAPTSESELTPAQVGLGIGTGEGRDAAVQAGFQLACLVTTLAIAIIGGLVTGEGQ